MKNLSELLNDLEAKAKAATPDQVDSIIKGALNGSGRQIWHMRGAPTFEEQAKRDVEYYAACSPDTVLALITALRDLQARNEFLEDAFENQKEFIEGAINDKLALREARALISVFGELGNRNAKDWLAKYGEKK